MTPNERDKEGIDLPLVAIFVAMGWVCYVDAIISESEWIFSLILAFIFWGLALRCFYLKLSR